MNLLREESFEFQIEELQEFNLESNYLATRARAAKFSQCRTDYSRQSKTACHQRSERNI